jgi:hypothetical protein
MNGFRHRTATAHWSRSTSERLAWPAAALVIGAFSLGCWLSIGLVAKLLLG